MKTIELQGEINGNMFQYLKSVLANTDEKEVTINLNSHGGFVVQGLAIVDLIKMHTDKTIHITVHGIAASMAAIILLAATGKARATENSTIMFHQLSGLYMGKLSDVQTSVKQSEELQRKLNTVLINRNIPTEMVQDLMKKDSYLTAQEALDKGLIDEIIGKNKKDKTMNFSKLKALLPNFKSEEVTNSNKDEFENEIEAKINTLIENNQNMAKELETKDNELENLKAEKETITSELKVCKEKLLGYETNFEANLEEQKKVALETALKENRISRAQMEAFVSVFKDKALDDLNQTLSAFPKDSAIRKTEIKNEVTDLKEFPEMSFAELMETDEGIAYLEDLERSDPKAYKNLANNKRG